MTDDKKTDESRLDFMKNQRRLLFKRLTPRLVIYPIIVLAVAFLMNKNKDLAKQQQAAQTTPQTTQQPLDGNKPAELVPVLAPANPELTFYHENNLPDLKFIDKLREKYAKTCKIQVVDLTQDQAKKAMFADRKTPFAVFASTRAHNEYQGFWSFDFYDKMLQSQLPASKQAPTPAPRTASTTVPAPTPAP